MITNNYLLSLVRGKKKGASDTKGHGSGCTTALSGMHLYVDQYVMSNTAQFPLQWQYTNPAHIISITDTNTVPASKIKAHCAGNIPNTLMLAK